MCRATIYVGTRIAERKERHAYCTSKRKVNEIRKRILMLYSKHKQFVFFGIDPEYLNGLVSTFASPIIIIFYPDECKTQRKKTRRGDWVEEV